MHLFVPHDRAHHEKEQPSRAALVVAFGEPKSGYYLPIAPNQITVVVPMKIPSAAKMDRIF